MSNLNVLKEVKIQRQFITKIKKKPIFVDNIIKTGTPEYISTIGKKYGKR